MKLVLKCLGHDVEWGNVFLGHTSAIYGDKLRRPPSSNKVIICINILAEFRRRDDNSIGKLP